MHLNTLRIFRHGIYDSFRKAGDAMFNLVDALLSEDRARSFPELSLSPHFQRKWPSMCASLKDGIIDQDRWSRVFVTHMPPLAEGKDLWVAIDVSGIARPKSVTSEDRSAQHVHNLPKCENPITYGWQFSTVVVLPPTPSSWTYTLSQQRVSTQSTPAQTALSQLQALMPLLPASTVRVFDRGYDSLYAFRIWYTASLRYRSTSSGLSWSVQRSSIRRARSACLPYAQSNRLRRERP
jgi:hypothetical protein